MKLNQHPLFTTSESDPVIQKVAQGFLDGFLAKLEAVEVAAKKSDWQAVRRSLHSFKGATAMMGFKELSTMMKRMEGQIDEEAYQAVIQQLDELLSACRE